MHASAVPSSVLPAHTSLVQIDVLHPACPCTTETAESSCVYNSSNTVGRVLPQLEPDLYLHTGMAPQQAYHPQHHIARPALTHTSGSPGRSSSPPPTLVAPKVTHHTRCHTFASTTAGCNEMHAALDAALVQVKPAATFILLLA